MAFFSIFFLSFSSFRFSLLFSSFLFSILSLFEIRFRTLKLLQASINALGVLISPIPITVIPDSLSLVANFVKSESLETIQNPSTVLEYSISIASIIIVESVEFFPEV